MSAPATPAGGVTEAEVEAVRSEVNKGAGFSYSKGQVREVLSAARMVLAAARPDASSALAVIERWCRPDHLRLHAGEMTAGEMRTVLAVLGGMRADVARLTADGGVAELRAEVERLTRERDEARAEVDRLKAEHENELGHFADYCTASREEGFARGEEVGRGDMRVALAAAERDLAALREERDRLASALAPFARYAVQHGHLDDGEGEIGEIYRGAFRVGINYRDLRQARDVAATLRGGGPTTEKIAAVGEQRKSDHIINDDSGLWYNSHPETGVRKSGPDPARDAEVRREAPKMIVTDLAPRCPGGVVLSGLGLGRHGDCPVCGAAEDERCRRDPDDPRNSRALAQQEDDHGR